MKYSRLILLFLGLAIFATASNDPQKLSDLGDPEIINKRKEMLSERFLFTSSDATETIMTFSHFVETRRNSKPSKQKQMQLVEDQLVHMFGPMGESSTRAVPKGEHNFKLGEVKKIGKNSGFLEKLKKI